MSHLAPCTPRGRTRRQNAIGAHLRDLPGFDAMRENLLRTVAKASGEAEAEGLAWYLAAHSLASDMAHRHGVTLRQAAGVIAALSPQTGWAENIRLAEQAFADGAASGHYDDAVDKANLIMAGADPHDVLGVRAPKVRSFFRNIMDPTRPGAVTVDRHMVDCLFGERGYIGNRPLDPYGVYPIVAAVIRATARELGMMPHELQAVAWVAWRQETGVASQYDANF